MYTKGISYHCHENFEKINKIRANNAFVWCYIVGDYLDQHVKSIAIKKHGHRPKSVFKYGLEYISNTLLNSQKEDFINIFSKFVM